MAQSLHFFFRFCTASTGTTMADKAGVGGAREHDWDGLEQLDPKMIALEQEQEN